MHKYISYYILMFLKEHTIMFFSKIVMSTRHVYTYKCGSEPATYRLKWQYPVINEPKCCFLFVCCCCFLLLFFFVFVFFFLLFFFLFFCCCFLLLLFVFFVFFFVVVLLLLFFFWLGGGGWELDYFLFQLFSELCFPTWLFTFSKVCFKFSDQASINYRYPHVASVRLLFFVSIHSYYRDQRRSDCRLVMLYKVTYDLVATPASDYLSPNRRQSRHIQTGIQTDTHT